MVYPLLYKILVVVRVYPLLYQILVVIRVYPLLYQILVVVYPLLYQSAGSLQFQYHWKTRATTRDCPYNLPVGAIPCGCPF